MATIALNARTDLLGQSRYCKAVRYWLTHQTASRADAMARVGALRLEQNNQPSAHDGTRFNAALVDIIERKQSTKRNEQTH